jgi:hypothetical protein
VKLDKGRVEENRVARSKRVIFWQMSWTRPDADSQIAESQ